MKKIVNTPAKTFSREILRLEELDYCKWGTDDWRSYATHYENATVNPKRDTELRQWIGHNVVGKANRRNLIKMVFTHGEAYEADKSN